LAQELDQHRGHRADLRLDVAEVVRVQALRVSLVLPAARREVESGWVVKLVGGRLSHRPAGPQRVALALRDHRILEVTRVAQQCPPGSGGSTEVGRGVAGHAQRGQLGHTLDAPSHLGVLGQLARPVPFGVALSVRRLLALAHEQQQRLTARCRQEHHGEGVAVAPLADRLAIGEIDHRVGRIAEDEPATVAGCSVGRESVDRRGDGGTAPVRAEHQLGVEVVLDASAVEVAHPDCPAAALEDVEYPVALADLGACLAGGCDQFKILDGARYAHRVVDRPDDAPALPDDRAVAGVRQQPR
jgi:hypothetical protein